MATPWPDKPCPYCGLTITDLLLEMVPDAQQGSAEYRAINDRQPGGAITCAYCQGAVEYAANGEDLVQSIREPLRYSRPKCEDRAWRKAQVFLNQQDTDPEHGWRTTRAWPARCTATDMRRILRMRFRAEELEFLSAWAREERAVEPYILPAHRLQAAHQVRGIDLIRAIKAWARSEGRRDEDIFDLHANPNPVWPWPTPQELADRLVATGT